LFVVASNMLGSSFGSTNAGSIDPQTGEAYGPDFPNITIRDILAAQKALLDHLGVRHLVAVAGPSYGGYQAFQWAVAYPDFMDAIVPVNTAPWRAFPRPGGARGGDPRAGLELGGQMGSQLADHLAPRIARL
jgi:homoserine acetyltransferase